MEEYGLNGNSPEASGAASEKNEAATEAVQTAETPQNTETAQTAETPQIDAESESVDDILAEIMGDGGFNDDFTGLYAR